MAGTHAEFDHVVKPVCVSGNRSVAQRNIEDEDKDEGDVSDSSIFSREIQATSFRRGGVILSTA